jgi:FolB domain-containing protein
MKLVTISHAREASLAMTVVDGGMCKFVISDLALSVRLGCRPHERKKDQVVLVTIEILLKKLPVGAKTDQLEDTICYSKLVKHVQDFVEGKRFDLLEKFSRDIHGCIYDFLLAEGYKDSIVQVTSHKTLSEASAIKGGVSFTYAGGE